MPEIMTGPDCAQPVRVTMTMHTTARSVNSATILFNDILSFLKRGRRSVSLTISWSLDCLFAGCALLPSFLGGPF